MTDITHTRSGCPGASAQRVYESLAKEAEAWRVGAAGERTVARRLARTRGVIVLSDRAWPGRRANLDHVVIAPTGVFVIDTKAHAGRVELIDRGSFCHPSLRLHVAGWDRSDLVESVGRQGAAVGAVVARDWLEGPQVPVVAVLCFVGGNWCMPTDPVSVGSVVVSGVGGLRRLLRRRGPLGAAERVRLAHVLDAGLPPR
ncbi:MAG: nuclease-related domain-containing protein [Acidimicrobiales bacterium]